MSRRLVLGLAVAVAAGLAAAGALMLPGARADGSARADASSQPAMVMTGSLNARQLALHDRMRKLWEDHITWTRLAIVSFDADLPDLSATEGRLLRNQHDIGRLAAHFYGDAAGDKLTRLLRSHILIAVDVLAAAKAGDQQALADAQKRWYANAREIADFLHSANPDNWPQAAMQQMMRRHLNLTTQEAVAHLTGDFAADVRAYDAVHEEILGMADMLSNGIIAQFPGKFR
jgi:hypothetical protein